jgi:carbonic anhydrase
LPDPFLQAVEDNGRRFVVQKLIQGIHEFREQNFGVLRAVFAQLSREQHPETLFITCSDSRIDPNLLTRSMPGELFILRNAGNIVPPHGTTPGGEAATIEYAVAVLGVKDVIVCGHSDCGAVKALLQPETVADLPAVSAWLGHAEATHRIIQDNYARLCGDRLLTAAIEENVLVQIENLRTLPTVASRLVRGDLQLHGWIYKIASGEVFAFDPARGNFVPVAQYQLRENGIPRRRAFQPSHEETKSIGGKP